MGLPLGLATLRVAANNSCGALRASSLGKGSDLHVSRTLLKTIMGKEFSRLYRNRSKYTLTTIGTWKGYR